MGSWTAAARAARARGGDHRDRLLGVQPRGAAHRRGPLATTLLRRRARPRPASAIRRDAATRSKNASSASIRRSHAYSCAVCDARAPQLAPAARGLPAAAAGRGATAAGVASGIRQLTPSTQKSRLPCASVQTTAAPVAIASSGGSAKPSCTEVWMNTVASQNSSLTARRSASRRSARRPGASSGSIPNRHSSGRGSRQCAPRRERQRQVLQRVRAPEREHHVLAALHVGARAEVSRSIPGGISSASRSSSRSRSRFHEEIVM